MANIMRRNEMAGVPDFRREIDRLFEDFFSPSAMAGSSAMQQFVPRLEVTENDQGYLLRAELPGMAPEDVELNVDNNVLTVSGEKKQERSEKGRGGYAYSEFSYGGFTRSLQLPPGTDPSKIQADFRNGVLEVQIPKSEAARPRRIAVGGKGAEPAAQPASSTGGRKQDVPVSSGTKH